MRTILSMLSLAVALSLGGCASGRYVTPAASTPPVAVGSRSLNNLQRVASRHMTCPVAALYAHPVAGRVWQVSGCGRTAEFSLVDRPWQPARWEPIATVGERASNELACPIDRLMVDASRPDAREVSGCGRRAHYQLACDERACGWVGDVYGAPGGPGGITVTPPSYVPPPQVAPPSGTVIVVPDERPRETAVGAALRAELDRQRYAILACAPGAEPVVLRARWGPDGLVHISVDPSWTAGRSIEPCVLGSISQIRVPTGHSGDVLHVVR